MSRPTLSELKMLIWDSGEVLPVKMTALAILEHMTPSLLTVSFPRRRLAGMTGMSEATVERHFRRIERWIKIASTPGTPNTYTALATIEWDHSQPLMEFSHLEARVYRKAKIPAKLRAEVFARDRYACKHCGAEGDITNLRADHIKPESKGGETTLANLQTLCVSCNSKKGSREAVS